MRPLFKTILYIFIALIVFSCSARLKTYSVKKQQKDLKVLKEALTKVTGNPYLYIDSVSFEQKFSQVESNIYKGKTDVEWFQEMSGLVSAMGCGHTQIMPSSRLLSTFMSYKSTFPFDVQLVEGKLYCIGKYRDKEKKIQIRTGDEITEINGKSIQGCLKKMYPLFSSDALNVSMKDKFYEDFFAFYYWLSTGPANEFTVNFTEKKTGKKQTLKVPAAYASIPKYKKKFRRNPFIKPPNLRVFGKKKVKAAENYAYLHFESFLHLGGQKYMKWVDHFFASVKKKNINNLIIDLRGNLGGLPQNYFLGYLMEDTTSFLTMNLRNLNKLENKREYKTWNAAYFRYYIQRKIAEDYKEKTGEVYKLTYKTFPIDTAKKYKGNIIVLTDGMSFSSSANIAANLRDKCGAVIIGKTTGGAYQGGNTGQLPLILPKSNYSIVINPMYFNNHPKKKDAKEVGIKPDVYVKDIYGNRKTNDLYMKAAMEWIRKNEKQTPQKVVSK